MRDTHGRYRDAKAIVDIGPEWAHGCEACKCGIASGPNILPMFPLFEGRAVQAHEELILFCDCRAGFMYRQRLRKIYDGMSMELRRNVLAHVHAASVPTVHGELT